MGNSYSCCIRNEANFISSADVIRSQKFDLHLDSSTNFSMNHTTYQTASNSHQTKCTEMPDRSKTAIKVKQSIKPKRNRSSLVIKPYNIALCDVNKVDLKRAKSDFVPVTEYRMLIEERLCNFSKRNHLIKLEEENTSEHSGYTTNYKGDSRRAYGDTLIVPTKNELLIKEQVAPKNFGTVLHQRIEDGALNVSSHSGKNVKKIKTKKQYEEIEEPFTEVQYQYLKRILYDEELFIEEMDRETIDKIIKAIQYARVKAKYTLYSYNKKHSQKNSKFSNGTFGMFLQNMEHYFYIVEKGKIEVALDEQKFLLEREGTLSTKALVKNTKDYCSLITSKRVYIYKLPLNKYTSIFGDFVDKLIEEKVSAFKSNYLFANIDKKLLTKLANGCIKKTYTERTLLIEQEKVIDSLYIIASGTVTCEHNYERVRILTKGQVLGEMPLLTQIESFYSFYAEEGTVLYRLSYQVIDVVICGGENSIKFLLQNIFKNAIKNSQLLSKYFNDTNYKLIFDLFQLKYYFNDTITTKKNLKIFIPLGGTILETRESVSNIIYPSNLFYEDELIYDTSKVNNILLTSKECIILEVQWNEVLKSVYCFKDKNVTLYDKMLYIRRVPCLQGLSEVKLFNLAESLNTCVFKENDLIIKDGPISKRLFIIKNGQAKIVIKDIEIKVLDKGMSFGDIETSQPGLYTVKASFYAKTNLECYYLNKEYFDEIIDSELLLRPFNKLLFKDITIALDQLYYIKELGQGSYGKVYLVHNKQNLYAMKTAEVQAMVQNKDSAKFYLNEKSIMSSIDHPFIVQLINTFKTRDYVFFLIEYIKGKTLRDYLTEYKTRLRDIPEITFIAVILCNIITYLQKKRIIHRDLKPDNLMVDFTNGYIKAIDFGIAKDLSGKDSTHTLIGTAQYMAPEIVSGKNYSCPADVWAVGVILYEIFYGKRPFGNGMTDPQEIYQDIKDNKIIFPSDPKNEDVNTFLSSLLDKNPNKRMNRFCHWRSEDIFKQMNFDLLIKMQMSSPLLETIHMFVDTAKVRNEKVLQTEELSTVKVGEEVELKNTTLPFHRFIKNNILLAQEEDEERDREDVFDFLAEF